MFDADGAGITIDEARARLGLTGDSAPGELQGAFHRAIEVARGSAECADAGQFAEVLEAYRVVRAYLHLPEDVGGRRFDYWPTVIDLTPAEAMAGGMKTGRLLNGRPFETKLPPGLRDGDLVWVWGWLLQVRIHEEPEIAVRQGDVWMAVRKAADELRPGHRLQVSTPLGPWSFRLSEEAVRQRMVRVPGAGLPPSRGRPAGDLYVLFQVKQQRHGAAALLHKLAHPWAA